MRLLVGSWFLAMALVSTAHAESILPDGAPRITLVTFGPGTEVHQYFGHNALIVSGIGGQQPLVYNYGMFGFGPDMIPKFLRGRLEFWVGALPLGPTFDMYVAQDRDVRLIPLALTPEQRTQIANELARDASPEHRDYLYNHYDNNCSTRVRDVIDHALKGQLKRAWSTPTRRTLRDHTRRYTQEDPLIEWLMMFGLSDSVDQPITRWDETFLPDELEQAVLSIPAKPGYERSTLGKRTIVHDDHVPPPAAMPPVRWPWLLLLGMISAALALWTGLRATKLDTSRTRWAFAIVHGQLSFVLGFLGALLLSLWFTDHLVAHGNENLFMANPLPLLASALTFGLLKPRPAIESVLRAIWLTVAATTVLLLIAKPIVPALDQDISMTATLIAPINLAFAYVFWKRRAFTHT